MVTQYLTPFYLQNKPLNTHTKGFLTSIKLNASLKLQIIKFSVLNNFQSLTERTAHKPNCCTAAVMNCTQSILLRQYTHKLHPTQTLLQTHTTAHTNSTTHKLQPTQTVQRKHLHRMCANSQHTCRGKEWFQKSWNLERACTLPWKSRASTPVYNGSQGPAPLSTMEVKGQNPCLPWKSSQPPCLPWKSRASPPVYNGSQGPAPLSTMEVNSQHPCLQWKSRANTPVYHAGQGPPPLSTMQVKGQHPCLPWKSRVGTPVYHGSQGPAPLSTMEVKGQPPYMGTIIRAHIY